MLGAIYGDIIGSRFEFDRGGKTTKFELFTKEDGFTDDTVMTAAVADALLSVDRNASLEEIQQACIERMQFWGRKYPYAGYGNRFIHWLREKNPQAYGSYGNGSAMRVAAAGWLYDTLERTIEVAGATAVISHNHPEGMKGAECTAAVIFLSRKGMEKAQIFEYVTTVFGYDLSESLDEMRKRHAHIETCQDSMPKALVAFFTGDSYEEVVRNAVSLGGDTDTIGAIAGSMAEAMYGIPEEIKEKGNAFLPADIIKVMQMFSGELEKMANSPDYGNNVYIKYAIEKYYSEPDNAEETTVLLLNVLVKRMLEEGEAPTPMVDVNHVMNSVDIDIENLEVGSEFTLDQSLVLRIDQMQDEAGKKWLPLFTDPEELHKGETTNINLNLPILRILEQAVQDEEVEGIVINPFGQFLSVQKELVEAVLKHYRFISEGLDS